MTNPHKAKKTSSEDKHIVKEFDKAAEVALFYGFSPIRSPKFEKIDQERAKNIIKNDPEHVLPDFFPKIEERAAIFRMCEENNLFARAYPLMVYYRRPLNGLGGKKSPTEHHSTLEIFGSASGICEAIAVRAALAILREYGFENTSVNINTVGDKDSIGRFERELQNYQRKVSHITPEDLKSIFKKNPYEMIRNKHEAWHELREQAPKPMNFLSQQSIEHFKEVLEHFESLSIPYNVDHSLVGHSGYCSHTVFEIKHDAGENSCVLAYGSRHNHISRRLGHKKDIPILSVNIGFKKPQAQPKVVFKKIPTPKFYFIQFGSQAKLRSLTIIETLRQARIPVHHSLTKDKLVGQIVSAETSNTPYVIIMGQKEALDGTVVVRHVVSRVQQTVSINDLATYLGRLKAAK